MMTRLLLLSFNSVNELTNFNDIALNMHYCSALLPIPMSAVQTL